MNEDLLQNQAVLARINSKPLLQAKQYIYIWCYPWQLWVSVVTRRKYGENSTAKRVSAKTLSMHKATLLFQQYTMALKIKLYCFRVNKSIFSWQKLLNIFIHLARRVTNRIPPFQKRKHTCSGNTLAQETQSDIHTLVALLLFLLHLLQQVKTYIRLRGRTG